MLDVLLGSDSPWTAVRRHLIDARLRQLLQEERHLGQHGVDGLGRCQPGVRAADQVGRVRHWTSGRSMV